MQPLKQNSRTFNVTILDSGCTRYMFVHKCHFTYLRPEVPALGVGNVGFLNNCLWVPMLKKDLISESQLATEDHLGIYREPNSPEAIIYGDSIL